MSFWNYPRITRKTTPKRISGAKFDSAEFIAWDGEGYTKDDGEHVYFLLANSKGESIADAHGLLTRDCFDFLLSAYQRYPDAIHVCFGASYDCNMFFRDIDWRTLEDIWKNNTNNSVRWGDYYIQYRQHKQLSLCYKRRWVTSEKTKKTRVEYDAHCTLWDVFGFFQTSFVKACDSYLGTQYPHRDIIVAGKERRSQFTPDEFETIRTYCFAELQTLVSLMNTLRDYLKEAGIRINRWDGPGAIAAEMMRTHKVKEHYGNQNVYPPISLNKDYHISTSLSDAIQHAYSGGRMEVVQYGHFEGPIYHYDINSAYPDAASRLPCLAHGRWTWRQDTVVIEPYSLYHVRWKYRDGAYLYPLFYRNNDMSIDYPSEGEGWYWGFELQYQHIRETVHVLEAWTFEEGCDERPFAFIQELYDTRQRWKRDGNGAEKALKLGLNSIYGKLAQHVGSKSGQPPMYHNLAYAGMITSATRHKLYESSRELTSLSHYGAIMLATDGFFSTIRQWLNIGEGLGQWTEKIHDELIVVQSGVYWVRDGDEWTEMRRGFDEKSLTKEKVMNGWKDRIDTIAAQSTRFVTLGSAVSNQALRREWRRWRTIDRDMYLWPQGKRRTNGIRQLPSNGPVYTYPSINATAYTISAPYPLPWTQSVKRDTIDGVPAETYLTETDNI